jgi:hypothetical protein
MMLPAPLLARDFQATEELGLELEWQLEMEMDKNMEVKLEMKLELELETEMLMKVELMTMMMVPQQMTKRINTLWKRAARLASLSLRIAFP